ncbi:GNAT family N-acetyltransferase [Streptomyces sp. NPDC006879]|uniref:GNAT family N-acetyltransferase n=1 Tax=Streptomyces sp. NPDC006879 TaxID=3364767 RepID=UPI0036D15992
MTEIHTPRLLLRPWQEDDLMPLAEIHADPGAMRWVEDGSVRDLEQTAADLERWEEDWDEEGFGLFAVELLGSGELIGCVGLSVPADLPQLLPTVQISWRLGRQFWGQGYASEAAQACLEYALQDRGLDRVIAVAQPGDTASLNIMDKLGMSHEQDTVHPAHGHAVQVHAIDLTEFQV